MRWMPSPGSQNASPGPYSRTTGGPPKLSGSCRTRPLITYTPAHEPLWSWYPVSRRCHHRLSHASECSSRHSSTASPPLSRASRPGPISSPARWARSAHSAGPSGRSLAAIARSRARSRSGDDVLINGSYRRADSHTSQRLCATCGRAGQGSVTCTSASNCSTGSRSQARFSSRRSLAWPGPRGWMITTPLTHGAWCHLPRQDKLVRHDLERLAEPGDRPLVARAGVLGKPDDDPVRRRHGYRRAGGAHLALANPVPPGLHDRYPSTSLIWTRYSDQ